MGATKKKRAAGAYAFRSMLRVSPQEKRLTELMDTARLAGKPELYQKLQQRLGEALDRRLSRKLGVKKKATKKKKKKK